jgi:hypothetical protein
MKHRGHFFKGQMAVVMTFAIATLLGAMALGTDVAVMYFNWVQLQKGADAAALAGAFYLLPANSTNYPLGTATRPIAAGCDKEPDAATTAACTYASNNNMATDAKDLKVNEPGVGLPAKAPTPNIQVWVNRSNLPYLFGKVIGLNTYNVSAIATATNEPGGNCSNCNLFPILYECKKDANGKCMPCNALTGQCPGMSDQFGAQLTFGYKFSSVSGTGSSGNWSWLDVGQGKGGSQLQTAISGGDVGSSNLSVSSGSTITTDPGVDTGNVSKGWTARMDAHNTATGNADPNAVCKNASSPSILPNDPLLVTIPVADISGCSGRCTVPILGFAEFYMTGLTKTKGPNWQLTGCIVNEPTPNLGGDPNAPGLGTNAIALIE